MAHQSWSVLDAPNPTYLWTQLLVEELVRSGVGTFFVAPGSRSTPLTVAIARHPEAESVLHVDERGAAFAALGVGRATQRPAAWVTTSGTAVANGLPAAVEASVDGVPMLLLTADRPPELRDTGANQTIDQVKIFGDYVRWQADVPPPSNEVDPAYVLTTADQALHRTLRAPPGPVHLNCMFRKPLEPVETEASVAVPTAVEEWATDTEPYTHYPTPNPTPPGPEVDALAKKMSGTAYGLVVAGRLDSAAAADASHRLATHLGWPLVPDLTSRLRRGGKEGPERVPYGDLVLTSEAFRESHPPTAVLQVGGRFASKRLRLFLRDSAPEVWAVVRPAPTRIDPDHRVTHHVEAAVPTAADALIARLEGGVRGTTWRDEWASASERAGAVVQAHIQDSDTLTDPLVATLLTEEMPSEHALVAASSMPVRDLNRHAAPVGAGGPAYANRGASGIDGTVATAAGVAEGRDGPVTLLIGDLALWHDLNGLALLQDRPVVAIVVNNDGGGIFHFLPIREHDEFDPYFTTPHGQDFEHAAALFGLPYHRPDSPSAFRSAYAQACRSGGAALIEVQTDRTVNRQVHDRLEASVERAVSDG
ncbi:2-succinyl-5-enolpyruvyl-6-hydroxy-3-cyclohexene-1-carboxylic-acid synthase [Salinibacter grassmerensis]|uniref:2-succinyl-5-enolpyruvyl-6-hydroxy-3- cyclohexene-1-carboxylic-acid synthase n=1 Tax=Salinibacter grassmerensis TaxID=3040353 RepID=UPI0021E907F1|nr:2-succinyl-5-enolpyruvyl-6-hydroxy-3-cyclohexene-1-carboxylic-acid synthase [Salinibacter grassmerensis]